MKCPNCGKENVDPGKYCEYCGAELNRGEGAKNQDIADRKVLNRKRALEREGLEHKNTMDEGSSDGKKKRGPLKVISAILLALALVLCFIFYKNYSFEKKLEKADNMMEAGSYESARDMYKPLAEESGKEEVIKKLQRAEKYLQAQENLDEGKDYIKSGKLEKAMKAFSSISEDTPEIYEEAKKEIEKMESDVVSSIDSSIEDMDFSGAKRMADSYLKLNPDSSDVESAKDRIAQVEKEEDEKLAKEAEDQKIAEGKISQEKEAAKDQAKQNERTRDQAQGVKNAQTSLEAYSLIGLETTTTSDKANLRSGPSIDSSIITNVSKGSYVYIYDVVPDTSRIWCHAIVTSSVTGNTYDAWISSRNLDYSL